VASTLIVAGALVIPLLVDAFSSSATTIWVTDPSELPSGIGAAVLDDYSLEADFEGTVLVAAGITLDCAGHTITGNGVGVLLSEESELQACDVVGPGAGVGIRGRGVVIEDLVVRGVDVGVVVEPEGTLDCGDSTISGSDPVVGIYPQDGAMITNCRVSGFNTAVGLGGSRDVVVEGVYASGNRIGFYLVNGSTGILISDSTAEDNEIGFLFERSVTNVTVERNHALQNSGAGFQIGHTTSSLFSDNDVEGGGSGFWLTQSHDNRFEGNTVSNASQWFSIGLERSSSRNLFVANEVSGGGVGIAVFGDASNNQFVENSLHHNTKGAHTEAGTGGNTFSGNLVNDNSHVGLWDDTTGALSRYSANECSNNADANSVPDGLC
jgi:nitrous oxidase accessory protein NosD